ncbi:MAG: endonuclease [Thermoleophilia bacterium]|nr:endonuclease [Thermoleophilia bacterium]
MQLASLSPVSTAVQFRPVSPTLAAGTTATHQREGGEDLTKYYATAQGKEGAELLRALHLIVRTGHVDRGYAQARDELFGEVEDLDGDNRIEDLFTGEVRGPITDRKNGYDKGFNTEHTWPQSKGATGIAQSDLHHLHPADTITNERRGHLPYGDVVTIDWSVGEGVHQAKRGVDALGTTVFEPHAAVKGDIARGLLYFYTRYAQSRTSDFTLENFRHELPTLLAWNKADPVTDAERARNDAVQKVQGNRNPYVDHPEFIDQVKFATLDLGRD